FERFKKMEKSRPPEWLSTHPLPENRIREWKEKLEALKPSGTFIKNTFSFNRIKEKLLATQPSFAELEKGKKALNEKDYEKAKAYFLKALDLYSNNVPAYLYLARVYLKERDYLSARDAAFKALKLNPELFSAHLLCGIAEFHLQNWERALAYFEKTKKIIPYDGISYYYAGRSYENLGNLIRAKENYQKALEIGPKNANWYQDCYYRYQRLKVN
ncbi:MAG: tetratricopeptide repeat protein, partial [Caldimicrobium sp.]